MNLRITIVCALLLNTYVAMADLLPIHASGTRFVDDRGQQVILKGCNLGNYLVLETWMLHWQGVHDQYEIEQVLTERFGREQKDRWFDQYRANFIQDRDLELIKRFGFNCVRLPVHYNLVLQQEPPYSPREDAFRWIDHVLTLAEKHDLYVILDLHAAAGAQSVDHNSGRSKHNRLWTDADAQRAMVEFWKATAARYRARNVIAAYDILNEPYGDYRTDIRKTMLDLALRVYNEIRAAGDTHIVIFPGTLQGIDFYDTPVIRGLKDIGFTEHFYPGLFGSPHSLQDAARFLKYSIDNKASQIQRLGRPFLAGEFNSVLLDNGGVDGTAEQFRRYAEHGWAATMWSYKILKPAAGVQDQNWYTVTNAEPMPQLDLRSSSREQIQAYIDQLATVPLQADETLLEAFSGKRRITLPELPELPREAPGDTVVPGWTSADIGGSKRGATDLRDGALVVHAGGRDIFDRSDSFRFVYQAVTPDSTIQSTVTELLDTDQYAKAGVMMRSSDEPSAAFAYLHVFPDSTVVFATRSAAGERVQETKLYVDSYPVQLRIKREGDQFTGSFSHDGDKWRELGKTILNGAPERMLAGLGVCSHSEQYITRAVFRDTQFGASRAASMPARSSAGRQLLQNPSFEESASAASAASWQVWGKLPRTELGAFTGIGAIAFEGAGDSGLWQDAKASAGEDHTFSIHVTQDAAEKLSIELTLEATLNGKQVALARRSYSADQLAGHGEWSRLVISAPAVNDTLRVLVRIIPAEGSRGTLRFDDASLTASQRAQKEAAAQN